ncbi:hypothetical protein [Corynebacterium bovis]|uniref:hypothetical protein n=1 Tax=Corynebacterium bovis TaxID=36808 RepID=UPI003138B8DF
MSDRNGPAHTPVTPDGAASTDPGDRPVGPTDEPHWGDPDRSQVRRDTSRGERIAGIGWLTVGALASLAIEVAYLGTRVTVGDTPVPLPWTVLLAAVANYVLVTTALLWTPRKAAAGVPLTVWLIGFLALVFWPALPGTGGDTLLGGSVWTLVLMVAGLLGGGFPLMRIK